MAQAGSKPYRVGFLLLDNFNLLSLASAIDVLRTANQASGELLYRWITLTEGKHAVRTGDGMHVSADSGIEDTTAEFQMIIVVGGTKITSSCTEGQINWLKKMSTKTDIIGGVSTGSYVLAKAELLNGYQCTIHWDCYSVLQECFSQVNCTELLFCIDRDRITAAGGTAAMDMMLQFIRRHRGEILSRQVADMLRMVCIEEDRVIQRKPLRTSVVNTHPKLSDVVGIMENNIDETLSITELAALAGISRRQLERLFSRYLMTTPSKFYNRIRMQRAKQLVQQSDLKVLDIAIACGFYSASQFSKMYKTHFSVSPREDRNILVW